MHMCTFFGNYKNFAVAQILYSRWCLAIKPRPSDRDRSHFYHPVGFNTSYTHRYNSVRNLEYNRVWSLGFNRIRNQDLIVSNQNRFSL